MKITKRDIRFFILGSITALGIVFLSSCIANAIKGFNNDADNTPTTHIDR